MASQHFADKQPAASAENRRTVLARGLTGGAAFAVAAATLSSVSSIVALQERKNSQTESVSMADSDLETIISKHDNYVVLINVFTVLPENQRKLADILVRMHRDFIADVPGFMSANVYMSLDGERVIVYAQYRDLDAVKAMQESNVTEIFREALALGEVQFNRLRLYDIIHART